MSTPVTTELIGERPALGQIECGLPLTASWLRGGDGLIGFGEYKKKVVRGPKRFIEARQWWREELAHLSVTNNVHGVGTGPILFTSFSFDENEESVLVVPQVLIGKRGDQAWATYIGELPTISEHQAVSSEKPSIITWHQGALSDEIWKSRVALAVEKIKGNELEKVVLARNLLAHADKELPIRSIVNNLLRNYPSTWVFLVDGLVGATPELLVRLSKSLVTSRVLAGTIRRTGDEARDMALAASLAKSSKDLEEHEYAVRSVADAIEPYCSSINVPESPFVLHLANVMHLATDVNGVVHESDTPVDIFTLVSYLHPSAAVCGTPKSSAFSLIQELEGMSRGRYAGPVGWVDRRGDGEMGIALRCGQINQEDKSQAVIFAGCGIVAGSNPDDELAESQAKLAPMRTALETL